MGHPFRIREIAQQSGLSEATVDRVLNNRGGVRASTARFHFTERGPAADLVATLRRIAASGSHGVILEARTCPW